MKYFWKQIPLAIVVCMIFAVMYFINQQALRMNANDPQIQMAEDALLALNSGATPQSLIGAQKIDYSKSLSVYLTIYDSTGTPIVSSGYLGTELLAPPAGVFTDVVQSGEKRFTWQPQIGVRSAVVVAPYSYGNVTGFVLAGRSLTEVEIQEDRLLVEVFVGWAATLLAVFTLPFVLEKLTVHK